MDSEKLLATFNIFLYLKADGSYAFLPFFYLVADPRSVNMMRKVRKCE